MSVELHVKEKVEEQKQINSYLNVLSENIELGHSAVNTLETMLEGVIRTKPDTKAAFEDTEELVPIAYILYELNNKVALLIDKVRSIQQRLEI